MTRAVLISNQILSHLGTEINTVKYCPISYFWVAFIVLIKMETLRNENTSDTKSFIQAINHDKS